jgi:glucuronate isomerase
MEFLGETYLIENDTGQRLFSGIRDLPLIDAHNHADVAEIADNNNYPDIWQVEAATDHYVWSMLRKRGVPEHLITGNATNQEKWLAAATVWDELAGSPTYEWVHLDLFRTLNIKQVIDSTSGASIWEQSLALLKRPEMKPQALLAQMNVDVMCSTDDPIDDLADHRRLADSDLKTRVYPTFRPDRAMNIFKSDWRDYITLFENRVNDTFKTIDDLIAALRITHDYFAEHGCRATDHGVEIPYGMNFDKKTAGAAFQKAYRGESLTPGEEVEYMSCILDAVAALNSEKNWVCQIHIGAVRNVRDALLESLGPDSGGDMSSHTIDIVSPLRDLLNRYDGKLNVVLYCLEPGHQPTLTTLARAFGATVNVGAAWWFNDAPIGMKRQLEYIGEVDLLANLAGMVSDSRKLASYASRHEMFRRVLCDVIGRMVEGGRIPEGVAERLVTRMAGERTRELFGF